MAVHATANPRPCDQSAIATGTAHTQWCDQETGEASSIASPASPVPSSRSPRRHHVAATSSAAPTRGSVTPTQRSAGGGASSSRVRTPYVDWLCASHGGPTLSASSSPSVQYDAAAP